MKNVLVIGSGPSGLMSVYTLIRKSHDINVTLIEADNEIGKRIKISGNGRCNFFHEPIDYKYYSNGNVNKYMDEFLSNYKDIFNDLGIIYYHDEEGRCYPITNSSKTIIYLFVLFMKKNNVNVLLNTYVSKLEQKNNKVYVTYNNDEHVYDAVILAIGGFSYQYDKEKKSSFLKENNLPLTLLSPSLVPIKTSSYKNKNLNGKQIEVILSLTYLDKIIFKENGKLLFKKDGISGIVTFNLSSYLARNHLTTFKDYKIHIDFAPNLSKEELKKIVYDNKYALEENLQRLFIKELKDEFLMNNKKDLLTLIKDYILDIKELYPFEASQVTSGGIDLALLNDDLSLKKENLIYPCGEILNIDGTCGGYNIAFCFASGYQVSSNLIKKLK